mmetsp:Transcript_3369/g.6601  ORF Transcript_3369/g.6601 Transcript_3369/m.6601 type:complete len:132 (+) Transcript_3369:263-658(+)
MKAIYNAPTNIEAWGGMEKRETIEDGAMRIRQGILAIRHFLPTTSAIAVTLLTNTARLVDVRHGNFTVDKGKELVVAVQVDDFLAIANVNTADKDVGHSALASHAVEGTLKKAAIVSLIKLDNLEVHTEAR